MYNVKIDFNKDCGKVKPMHAVNNGPVHRLDAKEQQSSNLEDYKALGIPFARTHDASRCSEYGGEHIVDVHMIFTDFDKDPYDENSYDFFLTDGYLQAINLSGAEVFYRLGAHIEHFEKRYGTIPPKDFEKWAVICEHIIRHYNEGWANGFNMDIKYWEIWNEPDGAPNWTGTPEQYYDLYNITSKHLKKCFPNIKVGGPALAFIDGTKWLNDFLDSIEIQPDFFSWHMYYTNPHYFAESAKYVRRILDERGWQSTELIINEWNYLRSFQTDGWRYSLQAMISLKGAAFVSAVMNVSQYSELDMLMYYDARPCRMNGLFSMYFYEKLKGYYSLYMFNELYKLGKCVDASSDSEDIYACAAKNDNNDACVNVTYYCEDDNAKEELVKVNMSGLEGGKKYKVSYFVLDEEHNLDCLREEIFTAGEFAAYLTMTRNSSVQIKIEVCD